MAKQSAGLLLYRLRQELEVFLVHPGGPFFAKKDWGSWTIPKGEYLPEEDPLEAAKREFQEETGHKVEGPFHSLASIHQKGGKTVSAWAVQGDIDPDTIISNTFEIPWPPKSNTIQSFPEIDRAAWFTLTEAKQKINEKQISFLEQLPGLLSSLV